MAARRQREPSPPEQLRQLQAQLEREPGLALGYVLRGEERYFRERALGSLRARAVQLGLEVCAHDAGDPDFELQALLADLSSGSLFADARCVLVRGADPLLKGTKKDPSPLTRAALAFAAQEGQGGSVVISAASLRADHALVKGLVERGAPVLSGRRLWDSPPPWKPDPRQTELVQWLLARARGRGLALQPDQAAYVAAATGNDLAALDGELEKLARTGLDALRQVVSWEAGGSPFALADELVRADPRRAVAGVESLFRGGFQDRGGTRVVDRTALSTMLVAALVRQVRQALAAAAALGRGEGPEGAAQAAGYRGPPRMLEGFLALARGHSPAEWRRRLDECADLERGLKRGRELDASDFAALAARWAVRSGP